MRNVNIWNTGHDLPTQCILCLQMWDYHCQINSCFYWNTAVIKVCSQPASVTGHVLQPLERERDTEIYTQ